MVETPAHAFLKASHIRHKKSTEMEACPVSHLQWLAVFLSCRTYKHTRTHRQVWLHALTHGQAFASKETGLQVQRHAQALTWPCILKCLMPLNIP